MDVAEPRESRGFFEQLEVPVNPAYDFEGEPADQPDYANPVVLSNKLVLYANATLQVTKSIVALARKRERLRLERRELERALVDLRRAVLNKYPATTAAAKNLTLTDAHVFQALEREGQVAIWKSTEEKMAKLEDQIESLKQEEENEKYTVHTIRLASENVVAKLSFTKHEAQMTRHGI